MLENTEGAIKNGHSREPGNIEYTRRTKTKQKYRHNMCWTPLYAKKTINNVNKTWTLIKTTGGKDEPNKHK